VLLLACFVPFFYFDFTQVNDMSELFEKEELARGIYKNAAYQEIVRNEFPKLAALGFLDI
jgi:hypothetical protein